MNKPKTMQDLLIRQHIGINDIRAVAREIFDGETTGAGPEGYVITACSYDDLPEHVQGFINKAVLAFKVENVLDANEPEDRREADVASFAEDDAIPQS
jgi:hypothetical protein